MIKSNKIKEDTKLTFTFPKLMISDNGSNGTYLAVVLFYGAGKGMCVQAHDASHLSAGSYYDDIDMSTFKDYYGTIELKNKEA